MIRRVAEEPEPSGLLEEALGAPWAAFELAAPRMHVERTGDDLVGGARATELHAVAAATARPSSRRRPALPLAGLRAWRGTASIETLSGPRGRRRRHRRAADGRSDGDIPGKRGDAGPEQGAVEVHASLTDVASTRGRSNGQPPRSWPCGSAPCPRQHELLRGLAEPRAARRPRHARGGHERARRLRRTIGRTARRSAANAGARARRRRRAAAGPRLDHLAENRRLIVRRSLLATAVGGVIPLPVLDDYFAGRVSAGMLMKLGERRQVDIAPVVGRAARRSARAGRRCATRRSRRRRCWRSSSPGESSSPCSPSDGAPRRWRRPSSSACCSITTAPSCTSAAGIDRARRPSLLRDVMHGALAESERAAIVTAFREGSRVLGRSVLEAPAWMNARSSAPRAAGPRAAARPTDPGDIPDVEAEARRRGGALARPRVERGRGAASRSGAELSGGLVRTFERRWRTAAEAARADQADPPPGDRQRPVDAKPLATARRALLRLNTR